MIERGRALPGRSISSLKREKEQPRSGDEGKPHGCPSHVAWPDGHVLGFIP
jgi:hypothetical protein